VEHLGAKRGQAVILAGRAELGRLPLGLDQALAGEAAEQGVERAFGRGEWVPGAEGQGQLVTIGGLAVQQQQHTELDDAAARLRQPVAAAVSIHNFSVAQGTVRRTLAPHAGSLPLAIISLTSATVWLPVATVQLTSATILIDFAN
jgi:hypothetical protein